MTDKTKSHAGWTFAVVTIALFMAMLDNLVVMMAMPSIQEDLGGSIESLEWTVNAYTLTFAVFLLIGAALGDRFGRKRMFAAGLATFTAASAAAALAPSLDILVAARVVQGFGAALVLPLSLTLLSEAVSPEKRGVAIGAWSGISGLGIALGPVVGGAVVEGISWHWIFALNVPIGVALLPFAVRYLRESFGPSRKLDTPGLMLVGFGLFALVLGIVRANHYGWGDARIIALLALGIAILTLFAYREGRVAHAMLPMQLFRSRGFAATNGASFAMNFGLFGATFLLAQTFQVAQGYSPLEAGIRTLPWTAMPLLVAPIAGALSPRLGARPLISSGLVMQAIALWWIADLVETDTPYGQLVLPFALGGIGMSLVFAPAAYAVLVAVRPSQEGQASGALNAIREVGGVLGVAVLASVFAANGSYEAPQAFVDGVTAAMPVGAIVLAAGALVAMTIPGRARTEQVRLEKAAEDGLSPDQIPEPVAA